MSGRRPSWAKRTADMVGRNRHQRTISPAVQQLLLDDADRLDLEADAAFDARDWARQTALDARARRLRSLAGSGFS